MQMRLESARAKVQQAERHLETFARIEHEFSIRIGSPADTVLSLDGSTVYRRRELPEPPTEFSLVAGDCLQNARSALDHAVYALSKVTAPSFERTSFPISLDAEGFRKQATDIRHLPPEHQRFIESVQPYLTRPADAARDIIWQLHDLARIDRHRLIPTLLAVTRAEFVERLVPAKDDHPRPEITFVASGGTKPGDPLLILPPTDDHTFAYQPSWELYVAHADSGAWLEPLLRPMVIIVEHLVSEMESDDPVWPPRSRE
jgi:hypothetical protein